MNIPIDISTPQTGSSGQGGGAKDQPTKPKSFGSLPMDKAAEATPPDTVTQTGLHNRTNSCYQNVVLLALGNCDVLVAMLKAEVSTITNKK